MDGLCGEQPEHPHPNMENQNDLSYALGVLFATNVTSQGIKDYIPAQIAQAFADVRSAMLR